ncbi:hypothetical protein Tco_0903797 [Tanacetum coccineum]
MYIQPIGELMIARVDKCDVNMSGGDLLEGWERMGRKIYPMYESLQGEGSTMAGPITNDYISATRKSFVLNDNDGKMIKKNFIEIKGTFLVKIHDNAFNGTDGENVFEHINSFLEDDLVEKFVQKFYNLFDHNKEEEAEDDNDPNEIDDVPEIYKFEDDMFNFDTPLCIAFEEFNYLLKINLDLFTYDVQEIKTYDEYKQKLNNDKT